MSCLSIGWPLFTVFCHYRPCSVFHSGGLYSKVIVFKDHVLSFTWVAFIQRFDSILNTVYQLIIFMCVYFLGIDEGYSNPSTPGRGPVCDKEVLGKCCPRQLHQNFRICQNRRYIYIDWFVSILLLLYYYYLACLEEIVEHMWLLGRHCHHRCHAKILMEPVTQKY